ncbi:MAG TPA: 2-C-methyl-D-erythritol 4-phosphate cytidylyltransferase [Thermodesulfovibrionales bacterium]|nr:2-C-methyl-D-erythritol 4-phosphate cytidylyltransferase [Thermodesulfovibrionales bacterium]
MGKKVITLVPAAGLGKRLGPGTNKPFYTLLDRPLLVWTLDALQRIDEIEEIIPVIKESDMAMAGKLFERYHFPKVRRVAPGGKERQDSVYNGLKLLDGKADVVLIHDGVRPFVSAELVREALGGMSGVDGVIAAVPVKDTIKETVDGMVTKTLKREALWAVQTPQVFHYGFLMEAHERAMAEQFYATDDSALAERAGGRIRVVMGSYDNIKITTPEDISMAEVLLRRKTGIG